jgi:glucose dehydrogenase
MSEEPTDKYFGTPLSEWMSSIPNELPDDAVGLWQIIPALRRAFGLDDPAIEHFARLIIADLLSHGARPVVGSAAPGEYWTEVAEYGTSPEEIVDGVIGEWRAMGRDPDVGDVWFALSERFRDDP